MPSPTGGTLYRCRARDWAGGCDTNATVEREALEAAVLAVWRELAEVFGLEHLARQAAAQALERAARLRADRQPLRDELEQIRRDQDRLIDLQLAGGDSAALGARLKVLEDRRVCLESDLAAAGDILPVPLDRAVELARLQFERIESCRDLRGEIERVDIVGRGRVCLVAWGGVREIEIGGGK